MVDGAILEGSCGGNSTVGSNPIPSEAGCDWYLPNHSPPLYWDEDENTHKGSSDL